LAESASLCWIPITRPTKDPGGEVAAGVHPLLNRKAIRSNSRLPIRYKRKPLTEIILGDLLIGLGTASADSNSDPESIGYLNFIAALAPTLVRSDFFHF
jgi:hypothetical protein